MRAPTKSCVPVIKKPHLAALGETHAAVDAPHVHDAARFTSHACTPARGQGVHQRLAREGVRRLTAAGCCKLRARASRVGCARVHSAQRTMGALIVLHA
ncbi:hypothetical protein EON67_04815 [archaeon]|nr:MAG: hypothetical protein EON67_04815 [archaeon]